MNILSINDCYPPHNVGGAELMVHNMNRMMTQRGHRVRVLTTYPSVPKELPQDIESVSWVRRHGTDLAPISLLADFHLTPVRMAWRILRILKREKIDVIHATSGTAALSVWYATRISKNVPPAVLTLVGYAHICPFGDLLYSEQGVPCESLGHLTKCTRLRTGKEVGRNVLHLFALFQKVNAALLRRCMECFDSIIAISNEVKAMHIERTALRQERFEVVYPSLMERIHNGSNPKIEAISTMGKRNVLCVARLVEEKGIAVLSEAMKIAWKVTPEIQLIVVGEGPFRGNLQELQESSGPGKISLVGFLNHTDLWRYYEMADVVVVPSIWREPFGLAALEAISLGKPVVASNIGGLPEVLGECGILVEPDNAEALAEGILRAVADQTLRERLADEGPKRAEALFNSRRSVIQLERIYEHIAER